jgi:hypothetical protein
MLSDRGSTARRRTAAPPDVTSSAVDGRVLRGERNHALIVQAVYDLVRSGVIE